MRTLCKHYTSDARGRSESCAGDIADMLECAVTRPPSSPCVDFECLLCCINLVETDSLQDVHVHDVLREEMSANDRKSTTLTLVWVYIHVCVVVPHFHSKY